MCVPVEGADPLTASFTIDVAEKSADPEPKPEPKPEPEKPAGPKPELPKALSEDIRNVAKNFRSIADNASMMLKQYLKQARLREGENDRLLIVLPDEVSAGFVE